MKNVNSYIYTNTLGSVLVEAPKIVTNDMMNTL